LFQVVLRSWVLLHHVLEIELQGVGIKVGIQNFAGKSGRIDVYTWVIDTYIVYIYTIYVFI